MSSFCCNFILATLYVNDFNLLYLSFCKITNLLVFNEKHSKPIEFQDLKRSGKLGENRWTIRNLKIIYFLDDKRTVSSLKF